MSQLERLFRNGSGRFFDTRVRLVLKEMLGGVEITWWKRGVHPWAQSEDVTEIHADR
jgi:hypothetical protein